MGRALARLAVLPAYVGISGRLFVSGDTFAGVAASYPYAGVSGRLVGMDAMGFFTVGAVDASFAVRRGGEVYSRFVAIA